MQEFIPGQRWINDAELQLGLGTILTTDHRTLTILFLATGETRVYAKATSPLTRVAFSAGDTITGHEGEKLTVTDIREDAGLLTYFGINEDGQKTELTEGQLDNLIQLNRPTERLFSGQLDHVKRFELRYQSLQHAHHQAQSDLLGLTGSRTSLLPHQLYIAHEVANRYAPRVLLADEVGLGKTIEAGLILHQQLLTERAKRVLIVVPETLIHQWLVEMLRRFNLHFSLFDEERCLAATDENEYSNNPFETAQLIICSLEFLTQQEERHQQALDATWDLLIVDEAHHLQWSPQRSSPEYRCIETLATQTKGLILLTATPEQLGKESHFARLRLLDADRFPSFDQFIREEQHYQPIAQAVETLLKNQTLDSETYSALCDTITEKEGRQLLANIQAEHPEAQQMRAQLIDQLLDRHGTGRVLFRNTRATVSGFAERQVHAYPLPLPAEYAAQLESTKIQTLPDMQYLLCPERLSSNAENTGAWTKFDPRISWLVDKLKQLKSEKVLVITHSAGSAMDIADALRIKAGIHAALFHEYLSIMERDRAAAYFADKEYGTQVLICSEIGSEGRNFQFAHHLVLFDLPLNPDLLEQRIGRLDRIGQTQTIKIHVPYLENSAQSTLYRWYHEGLNAFEHTCPAGHSVATQVGSQLTELLQKNNASNEALDALIHNTETLHTELKEALHQGRDRLLEYNSCRQHIAEDLTQRAQDYDDESSLRPYLEKLFDCYGVESEEHSEECYIVRPSEKMQNSFPGLIEDGMTITYDRDTALSNEDIHFISWEHPMVTGAMEMVLSSELGNSCITTLKHPALSAGTLLVESLFVLEGVSNQALQAKRYLPPTTIRVVTDQNNADLSQTLSHEIISETGQMIDGNTAKKVVRAYKDMITKMVNHSETLAQQRAPEILAHAHQHSQKTLLTEIDRLKALQQLNPTVRQEEIEFFTQQWQAVDAAVDSANIRIDAVRVIIAL